MKQRHAVLGRLPRSAVAGAALAIAAVTASCGYGEQPAQQDGNVRPAGDSSDADAGYGTDGGYGKDNGYGDGPSAQGGRTGPAKTLTVQDDQELGQVVTDSEGWTLYRFEEDTAEPPASTCEGSCAETWPPVPAEDALASGGIRAADLGRVERPDGSWQLTLGGWPVYRYAEDSSPGDTEGHGIGGTWNALSPTGGKAGTVTQDDGVELKAVDDAELGKILTDAKGRTLYRFDKDTAWPMKSNCTGSCLETWKPAEAVGKDGLSGVEAELVGTYKRPDGTKQLAIDCWPVYWFTGDKNPGDTNGQGVKGLWSAVTDKGKKATG